MGKIPAKKHRGVKDVEKQRAKRLAELELRTNIAPKDTDEQAIPKSLERMIKLKEAAKTNNISKRKRKKKNALICVGQQHSKLSLHPKAKPEKTVPVFQQRPNESGEQFLHRISKDTYAFLKETAFEKKYGVQIERDLESGQIQGLIKCKREKDDVEILRAHKNIKRKKKTTETSLTKNEKRKLKLQLKREKKLKNADEFENLQDKIAFNEVAHEPPKLNIKSKKMNEERKPKNLLLNSLLENSKVSSNSKVMDRSGKRKNLPVIERRKLEKQQSDAIVAYRRLKSQRLANRSC
ncbi:hypothetical protein EAG_12879 [Camponotus floridanus]|uniref:Coiled-coil domain-containing protein 137 n=2 Tax=Camponotus floridanus TaxID=104421 RepID=E2AAE8_CAMFO|nr:coiled-coil domain-containing protein 137 isoform X1 [Camponotus floridanus]XP_019882777.1 coiled-coil domain-containing protein 137 isoform X1 [Camponotus floridanus]EFN69595.1 hypothetical protein EAG_12879 [Camponotus floridanus]